MEVLRDLFPRRALDKLRESLDKKYLVICGEPGLLKSEVINRFLLETKINHVKFLLTKEDSKEGYFLKKLADRLLKSELISVEALKNSLYNYFRNEKNIKVFVFEKFEEIKNSESEKIFWSLTLNSNPSISFIIETSEEIKTPVEDQTEKIDKDLLTLKAEEIAEFLDRHKINYNRKNIDKIISKTKGHGLFTKILLSEYLTKKTIPEKLESEDIEKILREKLYEFEPEKRSMLLGISCLERFKKEDLEKIIGIKNPEKFIQEITEKFLFIEKSGEYYFLNPIFKEFLLKELEKSPKGLILKKWILDNAAEHYLEKEDFFQALSYLTELKYYSKILNILNKKIYDIVETTIAYDIEPIIEKLPEEFQKNFLIVLIKAQIHLLSYKSEQVLEELSKIDVDKIEPEYKGLFYYLRGAAYYYLSNYTEAENSAYEGLLYKDKLENRILYRLNNLLGAINSMNENLEKAEKFYNEALNLAKNIKVSRRGVTLLLTNLGSIYLRRGKYDLAEEKYNEALSISTDEDLKAYTLGWLSQLYLYSGNLEKTLSTLEKMKTYIEKSKSYYHFHTYYIVLRDYHITLGDYEKAKYYNDKLKDFYEEYKDPEMLFDLKNFEAFYELIKGNTKRALEIANSLEPNRILLECEKNILLAKVYLVLGEKEKTEEHLKKAIDKCPEESFRKVTYLIPYFLFLYNQGELKKAAEELKKIIRKFTSFEQFIVNLKFNLKTFPIFIKEEEILEFITKQTL
ncbi:MAG: tetratricopeptide repeat protein [Candidatus Hydrothermales bacterium]